MRFAAAVAVSAALLPWGGCIQADQETTLYPDGSGKVTIEIGVKKSILKVAQEMAKERGGLLKADASPQDFFKEFESVENLRRSSEGVVAWKTGPQKPDGEWIRASYVAYFEDVNQVRIYSNEKPGGTRKLSVAWRLVKTKTGANALVLTSDVRKELDALSRKDPGRGGTPELADAMVEMMKPMLQDFKVAMRVTVPGAIEESTGFMEMRGRHAAFVMEGNAVIAATAFPDGPEAKRLKDVANARESRVVWRDSAIGESELAAWKKELAEAKEEWRRRSAGAPASTPPKAEPEPALSDDEIEAGFIKAKVKVARTHLDAGRKDKAREILEGVIKEYPNHVLTKDARDLLDTLK
jgi:hypothetical protein